MSNFPFIFSVRHLKNISFSSQDFIENLTTLFNIGDYRVRIVYKIIRIKTPGDTNLLYGGHTPSDRIGSISELSRIHLKS